jgi:hypothetical protein
MPVIETNNKFIKVYFLNSGNLVEYKREKTGKSGVVSGVYAQFPFKGEEELEAAMQKAIQFGERVEKMKKHWKKIDIQ